MQYRGCGVSAPCSRPSILRQLRALEQRMQGPDGPDILILDLVQVRNYGKVFVIVDSTAMCVQSLAYTRSQAASTRAIRHGLQ